MRNTMEKLHAIKNPNVNKTVFQATRFGIVGVMNTAVDYAVFLLLFYAVGLPSVVSKVISYSAGVVNSYIFNSRWTFKEQSRDSARQKARFLLVSLAGCAAGAGAVKLFVDVLGWAGWLGNGASICLTVGINFLGSKLFVFRGER